MDETTSETHLVTVDASELPVPAVTPKKRKGQSRRARLDVDWSLPPDEVVLVPSVRQQARELGWKPEEVRQVQQTYDPTQSLPMICQGEECFYAKLCPTRKEGYLFEDLRCPLQVQQAYEYFARYVAELNIGPDHHVDLNTITDLVRLDLTIREIDMHRQVHGIEVERIVGFSKDGKEIRDKGVNPLMDEQHKARAARDRLYQKLIADREKKKEVELKEKPQEASLLSAMDRIRRNLEEKRKAETRITEDPYPALPPGLEED